LKKPLFQRKKLVGGIVYRSWQHGPLALNSLLYPLLRLWDLKAPEFKPSGVQVKLVPALCHWDSLGVFAENLSVKSDVVPKQKRKKVVAPPMITIIMHPSLRLLVRGQNAHLHTNDLFIFAEFSQPDDPKKKGPGELNKGIFGFEKKQSAYLDQKNLDVASFGHCIAVGP